MPIFPPIVSPTPISGPPERTPVRRRPGLDFSLTGLVYCSMMMFMGLAAMNSQANLLFGVFGLMIGILLVSGIISKLVLKRLRVSRELPEHGIVGRPMAITYRFHNEKRFWPSLSVSLGELDGVEGFVRQPLAYLLHAAGGQAPAVPAEVTPKRRGVHTFDRYQVSTSFPFGFIKRAVERAAQDTIIVHPAVGTVSPRLLAMCRPAEKTGPTMRPRRGGSDEIYGIKEFRRGENPRHIHWRRSARTGVLVSREMTQNAPPRLLILVDTQMTQPDRTGAADVERVIAMAASVASSALEQGLPVGVHAWGDDGWTTVHSTRGKRQRRDIVALLARLPLNRTGTLDDLLETGMNVAETETTLLLVTPREVEVGISERSRGGMVVASAAVESNRAWFKFDQNVSFERCMPESQETELKFDEKPARPRRTERRHIEFKAKSLRKWFGRKRG